MAAHARLKNEFMEDEKNHNLMRWLISSNKHPIPNKYPFHFLMEKRSGKNWLKDTKYLIFVQICLKNMIFRTCELQCPRAFVKISMVWTSLHTVHFKIKHFLFFFTWVLQPVKIPKKFRLTTRKQNFACLTCDPS